MVSFTLQSLYPQDRNPMPTESENRWVPSVGLDVLERRKRAGFEAFAAK
jgi:hypothetical protein